MGIQANIMIIGLIGMSGAGKSYWSAQLVAAGFNGYSCDDLIAEQLEAEIGVPRASLHEMGDWMGLPYEPTYPEREALYLRHETRVLRRIVSEIPHMDAADQNLVIDLTGSAIYVDPSILRALRRIATIVYLAVSPDLHDHLLAEYLANPRPVIWNGLFQPYPHETAATALARCYPRLIASREQSYELFCDVKLDHTIHRRSGMDVDGFIEQIMQNLEAKN